MYIYELDFILTNNSYTSSDNIKQRKASCFETILRSKLKSSKMLEHFTSMSAIKNLTISIVLNHSVKQT